MTKPIRLSGHASIQISRRGVFREELEEAIRKASWQPAELDRLECRKDFAYNREWNGKFYHTKQVRPIFVEELNEILVITVYA